MASPERTIAALAEAVIPSPPDDATAGAGDVAAERFVLHYLTFLGPELPVVLAAALDGVAAARQGVAFEAGRFEAMEPDDRLHALRMLGEHEHSDLRDLAELALVLITAAYYGEWTGQDAAGALTGTPVGWDLTGYGGPAGAVPGLLA